MIFKTERKDFFSRKTQNIIKNQCTDKSFKDYR